MGAVTLRKVETEHGSIEYDSNMTMGALKALTSAADDGDLAAIMAAMSQIVHSWPYEGDPQTVEAWDGLRRTEFNALTRAVMEDLGEQGNS
jgi:hypothetical protein